MKKAWKLVVTLGVSYLAAFVGSLFTATSVNSWYPALQKPWFTPPAWLFSPVWTVLFTLIGISAYLVWREDNKKGVKAAMAAFDVQLGLNVMWSMLFFGLRSPLFAMIDIAALWLAIIVTIFLFWRISKAAAALLVPYILWVSFAAALNYGILRLN
ncbi:tryptophan-rich sensory protein [Candidatus Woesearchaeota archaeon]|nr:tryptophan-rich sensory protein [Candidatus Woesearchaeota archaeon]